MHLVSSCSEADAGPCSVAGTSCVDYSPLNTKQKGIDAKGESGKLLSAQLAFMRPR